MNKLASVPKSSRDEISPAEWQARVDLAAVYRLTAHYGWDDVIYNFLHAGAWRGLASCC